MTTNKLIAKTITAEGKHRYRVSYSLNDDGAELTTVVNIHEPANETVEWAPDFRVDECDERAIDLLRKSVLEFHKSRSTMMMQQEPISAMLPGGTTAVLVHKIMSPVSLSSDGQSDGKCQYRVRCDAEGTEPEYLFEVDDSDLPVASWEHRFWLDCGGSVDQATPLITAVLAFYKIGKSGRNPGR